MATPSLPISALLRRQAGVVSRAQALRAGLTGAQIDRLVARRRWRPVHPRVYRDADRALTDEARLRAAVLWAGDGAVLGGRAALWWHGLLPGALETITLRVPRRRPDLPSGVEWRQTRHSDPVVTLRGLTVSVRALALLDAAVETGAGGSSLLHALRGQVDPAELRAVAGHALSPNAARRLLADVSCTPRRHRPEWATDRNRYS